MALEWHGPRDDEGPPARLGPVGRLAVLADVHGNVTALEAVIEDVQAAAVDLVVFCGDLSWGPEPSRTIQIVRGLGSRAAFVRGNAERAVVDMTRGVRRLEQPRDRWMVGQHSPADVDFLAGFPFAVVVEIEGLGLVHFCHGSPRTDTELITPGTPPERMAELADGITERILVTGHTHLQFDRQVAGLRSINPGSVGLPYHYGEPGTAYWAVLGRTVELRSSTYDVQVARARCVRSGDPNWRRVEELLLSPPGIDEVVSDAERRVFAD